MLPCVCKLAGVYVFVYTRANHVSVCLHEHTREVFLYMYTRAKCVSLYVHTSEVFLYMHALASLVMCVCLYAHTRFARDVCMCVCLHVHTRFARDVCVFTCTHSLRSCVCVECHFFARLLN